MAFEGCLMSTVWWYQEHISTYPFPKHSNELIAKQVADSKCQQPWQCISTPWELFAMLPFLSHGQFCSLKDYIWRPAGLQRQLNYLFFLYIWKITTACLCFSKVCAPNSCGSKRAVCPENMQTTNYITASSLTLSMYSHVLHVHMNVYMKNPVTRSGKRYTPWRVFIDITINYDANSVSLTFRTWIIASWIEFLSVWLYLC